MMMVKQLQGAGTQVSSNKSALFSTKPFPGDAAVGLAASTGLLFLGLICAFLYICKIRSKKAEAKEVIKKDENPLYGVEYETDGERRQDSKMEDYDYMGD